MFERIQLTDHVTSFAMLNLHQQGVFKFFTCINKDLKITLSRFVNRLLTDEFMFFSPVPQVQSVNASVSKNGMMLGTHKADTRAFQSR